MKKSYFYSLELRGNVYYCISIVLYSQKMFLYLYMHLIIINNLLNLNLLVYLVGEEIVTSLSKKEQMEG